MIAFDTETTGLIKPDAINLKLQPYMIEICAIKFDKNGGIYGRFNSLVKSPFPLPELISKLTNIYDHDLVNAPTFIQIYDELCDFFLGEKMIFAHNCAFDIGILKHELMRIDKLLNFPWPQKHVCTVEKSLAINNKRLKLGALHEIATGKSIIINAHRAEADVLALIDCIIWMKGNGLL